MKKIKTIHLIILVLLMNGFILTAQEKDERDETFLHSAAMAKSGFSNQFRGTNCSGISSPDATPPLSLQPEENLAWKTEIANGVSSPCIWENSVFLTGYEPYDRLLITYCIDKKTGAVKWNQSVLPDALEPVHAVGSPAAATPVTDGKHVYAYFGSYGVICYDFEGKPVWEKKLPIPESRYGSCGSPVIVNNLLLVNRLNELLALDKETGETIYTANIKGSHATPVIRGNQILLHQFFGLKSINIDDGSENWDFDLITLGNSTPVLKNNMLFVNGFTNVGETRLYDKLPEFEVMLSSSDQNADSLIQITEIPDTLALFRRPELDLPFPDDTMYSWQKVAPNFDFTKDGAMNNTEWKQMKEYWEKYMIEHGVVAIKLSENETEKPELIWKESNYIAEIPSLLCSGNQVYMISNGGLVTCMNAETGEIIYREKLGAPGAYLASPLLANGHIYFISYNGKITVVKPGDKLNVISQCNLKEKIAASPVAVGNQFFVRTTETLYAFGRFYQNPEQIRAIGKKRDYMSFAPDWFGFTLDSFYDKENAFIFGINPNGARNDGTVKNDLLIASDINFSWNTFWDAESVIHEDGWTVEVRVPLSSLRFQTVDGKTRMGLILMRSVAAKNETVSWPAISPDYIYPFWKPSLARLVEFEGLEPKNPVYVAPYVTAGIGQVNKLNEQETGYEMSSTFKKDAGLDVKYSLTNNLTADLAINTDFAQVEADDQVINLTRFSLYFPEKRVFFLEKEDVFDFSLLGNNNLFYSRRIGLYNGNPVRIYGGVRLTGRAGKWDVGFLNMQTEKFAENPSENFGAIRTKRKVFNAYSYVGGMVTSRLGIDGSYNVAYGIDGLFRVTGDDYLTLK